MNLQLEETSTYILPQPSSKDKTPAISNWGLLFWWAHQDLNLGPKDSGLYNFHYSLSILASFTIKPHLLVSDA